MKQEIKLYSVRSTGEIINAFIGKGIFTCSATGREFKGSELNTVSEIAVAPQITKAIYKTMEVKDLMMEYCYLFDVPAENTHIRLNGFEYRVNKVIQDMQTRETFIYVMLMRKL